MKNKNYFNNFIYNNVFTKETLEKVENDMFLNDKQLIRYSFKYLNSLIGSLSKIDFYSNNKDYLDNMILKTVNFITFTCDNTEFNPEEVTINRKRIKKARESILVYSNKYDNEILLNAANNLDEIILDKNINVDDLISLLKELIDKKEDINIIKKLLNTNKGAIILNNNSLFDYSFNYAIKSIANNTPDIYYYIALLKIFYSSKINKDYYIDLLNNNCDTQNEFANEIYMIIFGVKRPLKIEDIFNKYGIYDNLSSSYVVFPSKSTNNDLIISIDDMSTKLRDDALSIRKDGNKYIINIYIADVGGSIEYNDILDIQARNNYKCIYLPNNSVRLFPTEIENILSLDSGKPKSVIALKVVTNDSGDIIDFSFKEENILVNKNLSYQEVDKLLYGDYNDSLVKTIKELYYISLVFESKNKQKIEYWKKKNKDNSNYIDYKSHIINSELMVLYNYLIASLAKNDNIPYVYRFQNKSYLLELINNLNIEMDEITKKEIENIYFKSKYSNMPLEHKALNISPYSHSTDPLRRYPDTYNQFLLHLFYFKDINFDFNYDEYLEMINYFNDRNSELALMKSEYIRALKLIKKS